MTLSQDGWEWIDERIAPAQSRWPQAASVIIMAAAGCQRESAPETPPHSFCRADWARERGRLSLQDISTGPLISGTLMAEQEATVRAEAGGSILRVNAAEGQHRAPRRPPCAHRGSGAERSCTPPRSPQ